MTLRAPLAAALWLALAAAPGVAQETTAETTAGAAEAEADGTAGEGAAPGATQIPNTELSTGAPAAGAPETAVQTGPQIYVREEHGDWEVRCLDAPEGQEDPCQLYQRLSDQEGNPTADVNFFDLPDGGQVAGGATILTPLRTLLTAQVTITIDGGQPRRYPYSFCDAGGCYARLGFTAEDLQRFRRGASATVVVVPALAPDQPAELTMSLTGFTAGLAAVEVANQ
ncbi:invasion associated locus B family protein [Jannaschia sp. Os4]|uniref:invasion associated locus B family protein n=1 Tax=Jannaschia sp. Os4 TaxID=2807617 RepID=UPI00193ADB2F|nr:invasion associated locus B family protein [Jannaschia sp. Os4]MBM2577026.1 invasion associated locus B family protein [Jannaschia sp. Os4]